MGAQELLDKVRELHHAVDGPYDQKICAHCTWDEYHDVNYPCETIKLLDGDNNSDQGPCLFCTLEPEGQRCEYCLTEAKTRL